MIDQTAQLDLARLVKLHRKLTLERAQIPEHSGSVSREVRRQRRKQRHELSDQIEVVRTQIVAWALVNVELEDDDGHQETNESSSS